MELVIDTASLTAKDEEILKSAFNLYNEEEVNIVKQNNARLKQELAIFKENQKASDDVTSWKFDKLRTMTMKDVVLLVLERYEMLSASAIHEHVDVDEVNVIYTALSNLIEQCITSSIVATVTAQEMYGNAEDIKEGEFLDILQTAGMLKKGDE